MKEQYEKPTIESDDFTTEMMQAGCPVGPDDVEYLSSYTTSPKYNCTCSATSFNLS